MSSEDAARSHDARVSEHELLEASRRHRAQLRSAIAEAADRVDEMLARAQEIAEQVRGEAEREAERYLAARRLEIERAIATQQAEARKAFESLSRELDRIAAQGPSSPATTARSERHSGRAPALLLAAQLAVMGRKREEIETALRVELGIERPNEIVDQILSPGDL